MASDWRDDVLENIDYLATINLYEILEVDKTDDVSVIKKQYKKLALKYHPDKCTDGSDKFEIINLAYHILSDDDLREKYNDTFEGHTDFKTLKQQAAHSVKENTNENKNAFSDLIENLNKKHGFNPQEQHTYEQIMKRQTDMECNRNELDSIIENTKKLTQSEFKRKFEEDRTVLHGDSDGRDELVPYEPSGMLSNCVYLNSFETLYDSTGKLEDNFHLPSLGSYKDDGKSLEQRMKDYQRDGSLLTQIKK
jgi:curved DNA-binding protein CbpA